MNAAELRDTLQRELSSFLWTQWAQMGMVLASAPHSGWAVDPEALALTSLEVGREDARLLDEALDWLLVNERLVSAQRLRNLAVDPHDRALVDAALAWLAQWRRKSRSPEPTAPRAGKQIEAFYPASSPAADRVDPAFLEAGFLKPWREPDRRSQPPDLNAPINLALRLRSLLGVGARAEVVRVLLTVDAPWMSVQALTASTAYAKRNVQEAAAALRAAGVAASTTLGNEQRFELPRRRWLDLLELPQPPRHVDWPQYFRALRVLLRWLRTNQAADLSDYMLASGARAVLAEVAPDLCFAGVPVQLDGPDGAAYWQHFVTAVTQLTTVP